MSNPETRKAAKARANVAQISRLVRRRVAQLEGARARAAREFEAAEEFSDERVRIGAKIGIIDEKMERHLLTLGRLNPVSERDRILEHFPVSKIFRRLATRVDKEVGIGDLKRTTRLLMSMKKLGILECEVISEVVNGQRVQRRWWWRVK